MTLNNLLPQNKVTYILIIAILALIFGSFFVFKNFIAKSSDSQDSTQLEEIDVTFDPEGAYALLTPRKDGNAIVLNIVRVATFDAISYQIAYNDKTGIDRGAGDLNTWINLEKDKTSYEHEILFGTCSKNVCKYDEGVENGTLNLNLKKGNKIYKIISQWHLQNPELTSNNLTSGDNHFVYKIDEGKEDQTSLVSFTVVNDLSGAPKLPSEKSVVGKVYALNTPTIQKLPSGVVSIELAESPKEGSKLARYDETTGEWVEMETKIEGSKLTAPSPGGGIFAVLSPK